MGRNSADYVAAVKRRLADVEGLSSIRFFGGTGLATGGVQFAMIMRDTLYFAVDDASLPRYEQAGSACFSYTTKKGPVRVRRYWQVPGPVVADPAALRAWADDAIAAARRGRVAA